MSEKKETKKSAIDEFRTKLLDKAKLKENLAEGIKSTNAKVRSLATKVAFKTQEHDFVKKNILPLMKSDKSKKVLRTLSKGVTRKDLIQKLEGMWAKKSAVKKEEATEAPAKEAPKAP